MNLFGSHAEGESETEPEFSETFSASSQKCPIHDRSKLSRFFCQNFLFLICGMSQLHANLLQSTFPCFATLQFFHSFGSELAADCIAVSDRIGVIPTELGLPGRVDPPCAPGRQVGLDALLLLLEKNCQFRYRLSAPQLLDGLYGFLIRKH